MNLRANKMLGVAVGEKSILLVELSSAAGQLQLTRSGAFTYTEAANLQHPAVLGAALGEYLKREGFSSKPAIFGVPAKWVLTKNKELPPVDPSLAPDILRLQVETEFSAELKDLVYDYAGESSAAEPAQVLLAAMPRKYIETIEAIAAGARLEVRGISPTSLVLARATTEGAGDAIILWLSPSGAELAAQRLSVPTLLRHAGSSAGVTVAVAGEVRRASLLIPRTGYAGANNEAQSSIVIWDDAGLDSAALLAAKTLLGPGTQVGHVEALAAGAIPAGSAGAVSAQMLALAGISETGLPVNFSDSRLAPPKKAAMPRQTILAIAAAVFVLFGIIYAYYDLHSKGAERDRVMAILDRDKDFRKAAEAVVQKVRYAQGWHAGRPRYLSCIRDLTLAIPEDGQIFVTSFNLQDNMKGAIVGKSTNENEKIVNVLADRLKSMEKGKRFSEVNPALEKRQVRHGHEITFNISFKYNPPD